MLAPETNVVLTRSGPGTPLGDFFRSFWVPCLLSSEIAIPDCAPVRLRIMSEDLIAFRDSDGRVGIVDAYCAHRCAPLFYGRNEGRGLRCLYHGWKYDVDGRCVDMPNEPPDSTFIERIRLKAYPTREAGGLVWAYMGPGTNLPEMPALEWLGMPASHYFVQKSFVDSNYLQALEGDHDPSHASFLHARLDDTSVDGLQRERTKLGKYHLGGKAPKIYVLDTAYGIMSGSQREATESTYYWRIVNWLMPFYSTPAAEPGVPMLMNIRVPIDDETSWFYRVTYSAGGPLTAQERAAYQDMGRRYSRLLPGTFMSEENRANDYLIDRYTQRFETFSGIRSIPAQDRAMTERMAFLPTDSPAILDRSREHLASADVAIIKLRARLLRAVRDLESGIAPQAAHDGSLYAVRSPAIELPREVAFDIGAAPYMRIDRDSPSDDSPSPPVNSMAR